MSTDTRTGPIIHGRHRATNTEQVRCSDCAELRAPLTAWKRTLTEQKQGRVWACIDQDTCLALQEKRFYAPPGERFRYNSGWWVANAETVACTRCGFSLAPGTACGRTRRTRTIWWCLDTEGCMERWRVRESGLYPRNPKTERCRRCHTELAAGCGVRRPLARASRPGYTCPNQAECFSRMNEQAAFTKQVLGHIDETMTPDAEDQQRANDSTPRPRNIPQRLAAIEDKLDLLLRLIGGEANA